MKQKIKLVGLVIVTVATFIVSLVCGISLTTNNGGLMLLPILYILAVYVLPPMIKDTFKGFFDRDNWCITKGDYLSRCFEEALGEKPEELITTLKGEEV